MVTGKVGRTCTARLQGLVLTSNPDNPNIPVTVDPAQDLVFGLAPLLGARGMG